MSADIVADLACADCRSGYHARCTGGSWDQTTDAPGACPCWTTGHTDEIPQEVVDRLDATVREAGQVVRRGGCAGEQVSDVRGALPRSSAERSSLRALSLHARFWADPAAELPVLTGAGGWDVAAA